MTSQEQGKHTGRIIPRRTQGPPVVLSNLLGSGGEGEVYAVRDDPTLAVKIYHDHRMPGGEAAQKLTAMETIDIDLRKVKAKTLPPLAWPKQVIKVSGRDKVVGMVMPRVDLNLAPPVSNILTPMVRSGLLAKRGISETAFLETIRWRIADNMMEVVRAIHKAGCLIGDVNDNNILANPETGEISIVDCDAFQIADRRNKVIHRCKVGKAEFTSPELLAQLNKEACEAGRCRRYREEGRHKPNYSCLDRHPRHDMFGVSVILFKLFMGVHPYSQRSGDGGESKLEDLIRKRQYPYEHDWAKARAHPRNAKRYRELPAKLRLMFHRTFA